MIGTTEIRQEGKLIVTLQRGDEITERTINMPFPVIDDEQAQTMIATANASLTASTGGINKLLQPVGWRDTNATEEEWTTTGVRYEIIITETTPIIP